MIVQRGRYDEETNTFILPNGVMIGGVHKPWDCKGDRCTIHKPTMHHMSHMYLHWRGDRKIFERICEHGVGHPDPDGYYPSWADAVHGCCGVCCKP